MAILPDNPKILGNHCVIYNLVEDDVGINKYFLCSQLVKIITMITKKTACNIYKKTWAVVK